MQRITTGILLAFAAAFLFGCGGSSAPAPDTGGNNGGNQQGKFNEVVTPTSSKGSSLINKPGQINVVGADNKAHLQAELKKYGYTLLHFKNGYSTVQVPVGQEQQAIDNMTKEYDIVKAEPVRVIVTPRATYDLPTLKSASFYPEFPDYGEVIFGLGSDGAGGFTSTANFVGQAFPMNAQGFNGGWQVTIGNATVATQPVEIAIIDAGWYDYSLADQPGLNDTADDANVPRRLMWPTRASWMAPATSRQA